MASLVVGLLGLKQSGKDTFASRLVSEHGFTRVAFADALKDTALGINPQIHVGTDEMGPLCEALGYVIPPRHYALAFLVREAGWDAAKATREGRRFLQNLGLAVRENVSERAWIEAAAAKVNDIRGPVVITDVRFPNEVAFVKSYRGTTVRVVRPGQEATDPHPSETAVAGTSTNYRALNDGSIATLHDRADKLARYLGIWSG